MTAPAVAHEARPRRRAASIASATRSRPARANRASSVVDVRGRERERDELRVRMLDRRARRAAVVDERLRVHEARRRDGARRGRAARADAAVAASSEQRVELAVVRGGEHDHLVRAGHAGSSPTIGYRFGTTRTCQPGRVGRAGADARDLGRRLASCPGQNGQSRAAWPARPRRAGALNTIGPGRAPGRDDHAVAGQLVGAELLHVVRVGGWPARSLDVVPVRFVIIGGGPGGQHRGDRRGVARRRGDADRARHHRRRRAPLGLHPEQGDGRDRQRARRARARARRWGSKRRAVSTSPRCASASPAWRRRCATASRACSSRRACA